MINWEAQFKEAEILACKAHQGQQYGNFSYDYHLREVVNVLRDFGATLNDSKTAPILIAAWLHDALEDTNFDYGSILNQFGHEIAEIVGCVTDEPGENRQERKAATYAKTRQNEKAIILKLADRIANVKASFQNDPKKFKMYADEQSDFSEALRPYSSSELAQKLWYDLEQYFAK